jgi:hypothetical protein
VPLFDTYIVVDWSASSVPKTGRDSIWLSVVERDLGRHQVLASENPATRAAAAARLRTVLGAVRTGNRRTLVGFDFPLGYPSGLAKRLGLSGTPWLAIWDELARLVRDRATNANNRYAIAAELNRRITGAAAPFWGCPRAARSGFLSSRHPPDRRRGGLAERRLADRRVPRAQPVWKLAYPGSAGGQALVGIPIVRRLRRALGRSARVWPFETGLRAPATAPSPARIVLAEVYPSLGPLGGVRSGVKDARQVVGLASHFARLDARGQLSRLFSGPPDLTPAERRRVEREEGWILGVM